jgi:hypothetical protein
MGVFQSDLILRSAVLQCLDDLRTDPTIVDDVFSELLTDSLIDVTTATNLITRYKTWITETPIKVKFGLKINATDLPCVAISLNACSEVDQSLGDVGWDEDEYGSPGWGVHSLESYVLGCFVHGEPELVFVLYSCLFYMLYLKKLEYLDKRGFMVSIMNPGPVLAFDNESGSTVQNIYNRSINLSGKVRHTWVSPTQVEIEQVTTNTLPDTVDFGTQITDAEDVDELDDLDMLAGYTIL